MKSDQDLYKQLRDLPKEELWAREVPRFNAAQARERLERVAVIRAVGMIFSRFGTDEEQAVVRAWLINLLKDPQEKIRRYALAALPKIGAGEAGEREILALLKTGNKDKEGRETRYLGRALEKVGGEATLALIEEGIELPSMTVQKVKAGVSRKEDAGGVLLDALLPLRHGDADMRVLLRCRRGLEDFVRDEAAEKLSTMQWMIESTKPGCVTLKPLKEFKLASLYQLRCFATVAFPLGTVSGEEGPKWVEPLARCIASERARDLMLSGTENAPRYRLEFAGGGHQRGAIRQVIDRAYALCPEILNDARKAPWSIDVMAANRGESSVELRPRLYPDPRLGYRQDDIAAASHPPLAACMASLAGFCDDEVIWDPFCGSGLELIERGLLGGVTSVHGTDLDPKAIEVARANFEAAKIEGMETATTSSFTECDFRDAPITPGSISLIITNPPLGRRVRIKDMQGLFADLYAAASRALRPGGRLVLVNPLRTEPQDPSLHREYQQTVDLGGFNCRLEMYRKVGAGKLGKSFKTSASSTSSKRQAEKKKQSTSKLKFKNEPDEKKAPAPAPAWWSKGGHSNSRETRRRARI